MFFFFKQKTAYEIKECDWSSDVCSSDLMSFFMISITIIRGAWTDDDGIELICPASAAPLAAGAVAKYHARENITPAGMDCLLDAMSGI